MVRAPFVRPRALEIFCGKGQEARDYSPFCSSIEGWDIKPENTSEFMRRIPKATTWTGNVFDRVKRDINAEFEFILIDNYALMRPFEHFDLFPHLFKLMAPSCFVTFTVYPDPFSYADPRREQIRKAFGDGTQFMAEWDRARERFYDLPHLDSDSMPKPPPTSAIRLQDMEGIYADKFRVAGWTVPYTFSCMRNRAAGYVMVEAHQKGYSI